MDQTDRRATRLIATSTGCVAIGSAASLATYSVVGGPFGTLNDVGNAAIGVLGGALAWQLRHALPPRLRGLSVGGALVGAAVTVIGSGLVISGTTGFFLAGLVSSVGHAGIGAWLIAANRSREAEGWPRWMRTAGLVGGALMALGITAVPGVAIGLDDMSTAPAWAWVPLLSWLGAYVAFPAWCFGLAASHRRAVAAQRRLSRTAESG